MKFYNYNELKEILQNNLTNSSFEFCAYSSYDPVMKIENNNEKDNKIYIFESQEDIDKFDGTSANKKVEDMKSSSNLDYVCALKEFKDNFDQYLNDNVMLDELDYFSKLSPEYREKEIVKFFDDELKNMYFNKDKIDMYKGSKELDTSKPLNLWLVVNPDTNTYNEFSRDNVIAISTAQDVANSIAEKFGDYCYVKKIANVMINEKNDNVTAVQHQAF